MTDTMKPWYKTILLLGLLILPLVDGGGLFAQAAVDSPANTGSTLRIDISGDQKPQDVSIAIQLVVAMTLLTLSPSIIMMMTCFTRLVIVLSFVRMAIACSRLLPTRSSLDWPFS